MSNRYTSDGKRKSSQSHAKHGHTCKCGRMIRGNGYRNHFNVCPAQAETRAAIKVQQEAFRTRPSPRIA